MFIYTIGDIAQTVLWIIMIVWLGIVIYKNRSRI